MFFKTCYQEREMNNLIKSKKKLNRTQQSGNKEKKYDLIGWNLLFNSFL